MFFPQKIYAIAFVSKTCHSSKDDIVFEMEFVKQVEVNIDYILMLVAKYHESNCTDYWM